MKNNKITFISEVGMNHNGNLDLSYELIKQSKFSGADIVKFQLGWRDKPNEINVIDEKRIKQLIEWSKYFEIELMFSVISNKAFDIIKKFNFERYKIASRTVKENVNLSKKNIKLNKETFVSLGMWKHKNLPFIKTRKIKYLFCVSKYPCFPKDLLNFPKKFNNSIYDGYSDHSIGIETCLIAITRGANIIEKHFTLDKSDNTIRDNALSATPEEFRTLVNIGRDIHKKINLGI